MTGQWVNTPAAEFDDGRACVLEIRGWPDQRTALGLPGARSPPAGTMERSGPGV